MNANFGTYSGMVSVTMCLIQLTAGSMAVTAVVTMYEKANVKSVPVNKKQLVRYLKKSLLIRFLPLQYRILHFYCCIILIHRIDIMIAEHIVL